MSHDSHPPAAPAAAPAKPATAKASPSSKVWGGVGTVIGVGLGIIVLLMIVQSLLPMGMSSLGGVFSGFFSGINGIISGVGSDLSQMGTSLNMFSMQMGTLGSGVFAVMLKILLWAMLITGSLAVSKMIFDALFKKMKGDDHH